MFGFFRKEPGLVEKTSLSSFVRDASSAEKKRVYKKVIELANEDQLRVLDAAKKNAGRKDIAAA